MVVNYTEEEKLLINNTWNDLIKIGQSIDPGYAYDRLKVAHTHRYIQQSDANNTKCILLRMFFYYHKVTLSEIYLSNIDFVNMVTLGAYMRYVIHPKHELRKQYIKLLRDTKKIIDLHENHIDKKLEEINGS